MHLKKGAVADRWTFCDGGHVHWGAAGGAGLLLRYTPEEGEEVYLLQLRSRSVDQAGTWGIPEGAMREGESPETAARREAEEEIGSLPPYRVTGIDTQECGAGWTFHIVSADVDYPFPEFCVKETDATGWFTRREMDNLTLHPQFSKWVKHQDGILLSSEVVSFPAWEFLYGREILLPVNPVRNS